MCRSTIAAGCAPHQTSDILRGRLKQSAAVLVNTRGTFEFVQDAENVTKADQKF